MTIAASAPAPADGLEDPLVIISEPGETPVVMLLSEVARRLGGEIVGPGRILCPGPGHSPEDRSLLVQFPIAADGLLQ
jgi:hypothetical protein